jgi:hypothetical protein
LPLIGIEKDKNCWNSKKTLFLSSFHLSHQQIRWWLYESQDIAINIPRVQIAARDFLNGLMHRARNLDCHCCGLGNGAMAHSVLSLTLWIQTMLKVFHSLQ